VSRAKVSGHFIPGGKGLIFVLVREPEGAAAGCVLVVPPFAEEMNKCRRMVAEASIALAECGIATVVPDLFGTGDSSGDFVDADWVTWQNDVAATAAWSHSRGLYITSLLATRLGCALATDVVHRGLLSHLNSSVLWQPVFDGSRFLNQFLRLRIAAGLMDESKETIKELRARLSAGQSLEVAGYKINSRLFAEIDAVRSPQRLPDRLGAVSWNEVVRAATDPLSVPSMQVIEKSASSMQIDFGGSVGEPFWASTEIVVNENFVRKAVAALARGNVPRLGAHG
jgi:exosortase A-associated hydrolase 2